MDRRLRQLCSPRPGEDFDARAFIAYQSSLYLVASQHQPAQAAPLLTALVKYDGVSAPTSQPLLTPRTTPRSSHPRDQLTKLTVPARELSKDEQRTRRSIQ